MISNHIKQVDGVWFVLLHLQYLHLLIITFATT